MELEKEAQQRMKKLLEEEKEKNDLAKQRAADFKEHLMQKHDSLSADTIARQIKTEKELAAAEITVTAAESISTATSKAEARASLRKPKKPKKPKKKDTLNSSKDEGTPKLRRFASLKHDATKKADESGESAVRSETTNEGVSATNDNGDGGTPKLRKFALARRKSTTTDSENSSGDDATSPNSRRSSQNSLKRDSLSSSDGSGSETASDDGSPRLRKFANMKRASLVRDRSKDSGLASTTPPTSSSGDLSPREEPKTRKFAQKNNLYKNLDAADKKAQAQAQAQDSSSTNEENKDEAPKLRKFASLKKERYKSTDTN